MTALWLILGSIPMVFMIVWFGMRSAHKRGAAEATRDNLEKTHDELSDVAQARNKLNDPRERRRVRKRFTRR